MCCLDSSEIDVDECQKAHSCDPNAVCVNILGAYECDCNPGRPQKRFLKIG